MISKRVSDTSCDSDHFNKAATDYNTALKKSVFNENIKFHARKSLLFEKTSVWVKKDNSDFDVTMGSYDGAEFSNDIWELKENGSVSVSRSLFT